MTKQPCIIVDIDGTLADCSHRRQFVEQHPKDWDSFLNPDLVAADTLIVPVARVVQSLAFANNIIYVSGRKESLRTVTLDWLRRYGLDNGGLLYMRKDGDLRADTVVKKEILEHLRSIDFDPWLAIDDRSSVVSMWRENGVTCLQVAEGDF